MAKKVMVIVTASKASEDGEMPSQQLLTDIGNYNEALVRAVILHTVESHEAVCPRGLY